MRTEKSKELPLAGITVVEFTHMVMGPAAGLILADLGGTDVFDANLCGAIIIGTNLTGANLKHCDLTNAEVGEISIVGKDGNDTGRSHKTSFEAANLVRANTQGCDLNVCVMEKAIRDS